MSKYRLYNNVKRLHLLNNHDDFIVAEVNWDYSHEFSYEDDWKKLRANGFRDHHDEAIHCWLEKYHPEMNKWLQDRNIKWRGIQSGDSEDTPRGFVRGFTVVCVGLTGSKHVMEFVLTWG